MSIFINVIGVGLIGLIVWWFWMTPKSSNKSKSSKGE